MLHSIATVEVEELRPLAPLGTRASDDPAIALIDAHAACLHVLSWNCLRLGDDATIGRTEDRDALVSLAQLLGAEPRPALAASTTIAFTLDDFPQLPRRAIIPKGTGIASVPGQDELPQTFETDVGIEARAEWNAIVPVHTRASDALGINAVTAELAGIAVAVKAGDHVLAWRCGELWLAAVTAVERIVEDQRDRTVIAFRPQRKAAHTGRFKPPAADVLVILGQRAAAFGATAPDARLMPKGTFGTLRGREVPYDWDDFVIGIPDDTAHDRADLDAIHVDAVADRSVVFTAPGKAHWGTIVASEELSRAGFGMAAKVTRVTLDGIPLDPEAAAPAGGKKTRKKPPRWSPAGKHALKGYRELVRETAIYIETARGVLFRDVVDRAMPVDPQWLDVAGAVALPAGRKVVLAGEVWAHEPGIRGPALAEVAEIERTEALPGATRLHFRRPVEGRFRSRTLTLNGNCAPASHGESLRGDPEILGSGGGGSALPRFTLARGPLAHVPADNPRGYAPALELRVDERLYHEVPTLYGQPPGVRGFTVRQVAGKSVVQFGGRLPTGTYNITATYRTGGGVAGLVGAGRLSTIVTPVLGVQSATNPLPSEGASDAVTIDELREAAPRSVQTLDRVVSLADYEAFAREFGGVGKAMASEMRDGMRAVVLLTIADSAMRSPPSGSSVVTGLATALAAAAVPGRKVVIQGFDDYLAVVEIALATDGDLPRGSVEHTVRKALAAAFGKFSRRFGEALFKSMLLAAVQDVPGVRGARIKQWRRAVAEPFLLQSGVGEDGARLSCPGPTLVRKAGLLTIESTHITFSELAL